MNKKLKNILPKLVLFLAVTVIMVIILLNLNDINEIKEVLSNVKWYFLIGGFILLFIYMLLNPLPLYLLGKSKDDSVSFIDSMLIGSSEYFFNGITPFSSGGQPFQVYAYSRVGVKPSRSTGILLMNFISYQIAIVLFCIFSFFFLNELTKGSTLLIVLMIVGFLMNSIILGLFCAVGLSKKIANILIRFVNFISNIKIFKGKLKNLPIKFESYCLDAQNTFQALFLQKFKFISCIILKVLSLIAYYLIPYFILTALNIKLIPSDLLLILAMTSMSIAMTCFIPTPGASGGIEFAFQSLFTSFAGASAVCASGMILWRMLTYYGLMILSFIFYLLFEFKIKYQNNKIEKES